MAEDWQLIVAIVVTVIDVVIICLIGIVYPNFYTYLANFNWGPDHSKQDLRRTCLVSWLLMIPIIINIILIWMVINGNIEANQQIFLVIWLVPWSVFILLFCYSFCFYRGYAYRLIDERYK